MKNTYRFIPAFSFFVLLSLLHSTVTAQTAPTISYQGMLQNNGAAVNGTDTLKIQIYNSASGGSSLYTESQVVTVANGIFNVAIGSVTPLLPVLDFTKQYYLAVSINGGPELSPRSEVSFAPYAFHALNADTAIIANGLSGSFISTLNNQSGAVRLGGVGDIVVSNTGSNFTISSTGVQSLNAAGGKLTLVGAGGTTIADTGTTITIHSQTFTGGTGIQAVQNSDSSITITNGSGPIAMISLGKQGATSGQVLTWNGSAWKPATTSVQNTDSTITITNPNGPNIIIGLARQNATSGQALVWNGTAWRPATLSASGPDSIKNLQDCRDDGSSVYLGAGSGTNAGVGMDENTALGIGALHSAASGGANTAIGYQALNNDTSGGSNTACGLQAMQSLTTGNGNAAYGYYALRSCSIGGGNCAFGWETMWNAISGSGNSAFGSGSLVFCRTGSYNTAMGYEALNEPDSGSFNVAVGAAALSLFSERSHIVAIGDSSLYHNAYSGSLDSATANTAVGSSALYTNSTGAYNTGVGYHALVFNSSGYRNTSLGYLSINQNATGNDNTAVGSSAGPTSSNLNNTTALGSGAQAFASNQVVIGNSAVSTVYCQGAYAATTANSANMVVSATGQIMRSTSSARYKTNIHDLDINTDKLYDLRPVSYTSKIDGKEYFGLVAEDVAKVLPDLAEYAHAKDVIPGSKSESLIPDAVKYPMLSVLLLEELKKEHGKEQTDEKQLETQAKIIANMEHRLEALEALQNRAKPEKE